MTTNLLIGYPDIPFNYELTASHAYDEVKNTVSGGKSKTCQLNTAITGTNDIYYNVPALGTIASADYFSIIKASTLKSVGVSSVVLRQSTSDFNYPSGLASTKLWLDAGKGVTADSMNRVSSFASRSGSVTFTQSTDANKPIWTRADNLENRIAYSEDFTNAAWTKSAATVSGNTQTSPIDGLVTGDSLIENTANSPHYVEYDPGKLASGANYRFSVYVKPNGRNFCVLQVTSIGFAFFNVSTGATGSTSGLVSSSITSQGSGWYLCTVTITATAAASKVQVLTASTISTSSYLGDGTSGLFLVGAQMRHTSSDTTYLATNGSIEIAGVNGNRALYFDGSNDNLGSTSILTDVMSTTAHTFFAVIQPTTLATAGRFFDSTTGASVFQVQTDGTVLYRHYDGSIDNAFSTATTAGGTFIVEGRHESGNIYVKVNNGTDGTTASGTMDLTTGTLKLGYDPSGPGNYFSGKICEIISFNAALTSTQRGHIYNMLNAKYQTTPLYQNHTLQATTLTGPNADDLITTFSTSALKNYWMVSFDSLTSSKRPVSKIYFGTLLDVGRDPVTGRNLSRANNADQTRYAPYQFSMTWQGLTDAVRVSVDTYIGQYAGDHCFILHPTSYTYTVGGYDPIYARIVDYDIKPVALNNNDLSITFEEAR